MNQQKIAFIFPGQGSQFVGMGKDLYDTFPEAKAVFEEIDETLHQNLSQLMFSGDLKELTQTQNAQPAIMAVSAALLSLLRKSDFQLKEHAICVAGHSLGEYTALYAAEALPLIQTAQILKARGQAMAEAGKATPGSMLAVLGLPPQTVDEIAKEADCYVANDNGAGQLVLSGTISSLTTAKILAENKGAKRAIPLAVAGAFHSPLMKEAQEKIIPLLQNISFQKPVVPVVMNVTADPTEDTSSFASLLGQQVVSPVRWRESVLKMKEMGVERFVECGPGTVLSGLVRRIVPEIAIEHISDINTLDAFLKSF